MRLRRKVALRVLSTFIGFFGGVATGQEVGPPSRPSSQSDSADAPAALSKFTLVEGQITDSTGMGLSDASVAIFRKNADGSRGELIAEGKTEQAGFFTILYDSPITGPALIVVIKEHFATLQRAVQLGGEEIPYVGESLRGTITLSGVVVSMPDRQPVAHPLVTLHLRGSNRTVTGDSEGRFAFSDLSPGPAIVSATSPGFGLERVDLRELKPDQTLTIALKPERVVTLVIQDDRNRAVAGTLVEVLDSQRNDLKQGLTDENGEVTFRGLNFDARTLTARISRDDLVSDSDFTRTVELPENEAISRHVLSALRGGRVSGVVSSALDGKPIYGARVSVGNVYSENAPHAFSGEDGRFAIQGASPGPTCVTAHASGFAPQLVELTVHPGEESSVELSLGPGTPLTGVVKSVTGSPIRFADIRSARWRRHATLALKTISGEDGQFVFEHAPADEFEILVTAQGHKPLLKVIRPGAGIELTLEPDGPEAASPFASAFLPVGQPAPSVTLQDTSGNTYMLDRLKGKIIVLDFWATWCTPCILELPVIAKAYERYKAFDVVLLGISRDHNPSDVASFLKKNPQYFWPQCVGPDSGVQEAAEQFGVRFIPAVFVIDRDGKIAASGISADRLAEHLESLTQNKASE